MIELRPLLLANENFPAPSVVLLRQRGYDVWSVFESARSVQDDEVLERAAREQRWILTFDRDYGELIFRRRLPPPPAVVLFRLVDYLPREPAERTLQILASPEADEGGYFVIEPHGQRWRPLHPMAGGR